MIVLEDGTARAKSQRRESIVVLGSSGQSRLTSWGQVTDGGFECLGIGLQLKIQAVGKVLKIVRVIQNRGICWILKIVIGRGRWIQGRRDGVGCGRREERDSYSRVIVIAQAQSKGGLQKGGGLYLRLDSSVQDSLWEGLFIFLPQGFALNLRIQKSAHRKYIHYNCELTVLEHQLFV